MCNQGNKVPVDVPVLSHTYAHVRIRANVHLPANASRDSIPPVRHFFFHCMSTCHRFDRQYSHIIGTHER